MMNVIAVATLLLAAGTGVQDPAAAQQPAAEPKPTAQVDPAPQQVPAVPQQPAVQQSTPSRSGDVSASPPIWIGEEGIVPPTLVDQRLPGYPVAALRAGIEGDVYIGGIVSAEGRVRQVKLIHGLPDEELNRRALEALIEWRFGAASRDGQPVPLAAVFRIAFEIRTAAPADLAEEPTAQFPRVYRMGEGGVTPPKLVHMESPQYPEAAREAGIEGEVYIEAVITPEGTITEPELVRGLADAELNRRALEAVAQWRFEPGTLDGEPVPVRALFTVTFRRPR